MPPAGASFGNGARAAASQPLRSAPARAGTWFWCAVAAGAAARFALAWLSAGAIDVELWTQHASGVANEGLAMHYARAVRFNHPPPIAWSMAELWKLSVEFGIPFPALFRSLVAAADLGSLALLWRILGESRERALRVALYAIAPVALVLAGMHGNTDAVIGTCLLGCVLLAARGRSIWAGVLLGASAWIKLPGLLAAPAIGFALPRWRDRLACAAAALAVASAGFAPAYVESERLALAHAGEIPAGVNVMVERVFGYQGVHVHTLGTPPTYIWGFKNLFFRAFGGDPGQWPELASWWIDFRARPPLDRSRRVALVILLVYAFLRRRHRTAHALGVTLAVSFVLFCGLVETWAFQYFAWSMALWMLLRPTGLVVTHVIGGGFLYALYAYLCSDWRLVEPWDFVGHTTWPAWLTLWRDVATASFAAFGVGALLHACRDEARWLWRRRASVACRGD